MARHNYSSYASHGREQMDEAQVRESRHLAAFLGDCGQTSCEVCYADEPGVCAWGSGAYGRIGTIHIGVNPDGEREECCTFG